MCGIFGVFNTQNAAAMTLVGLHNIQHRAIDFAGMASSDGRRLHCVRGEGIARQVFTKEALEQLPGMHALGHLRYPTVPGKPTPKDMQPILGTYAGEPIAIAHNGNLTNVEELAQFVPPNERETTMDSELILRLLEKRCSGDLISDLKSVFSLLRGSYSLGILQRGRLIAVRDPSGNRPLSIGQIGARRFCISSENCAFPAVEARFLHDVKPGTMVVLGSEGLSIQVFGESQERRCPFEYLYFAHPASIVFGENVGRFRYAIGKALEELFPVPGADLVTAIPDSANYFAYGWSESGRSGKFYPVMNRSHYVGRTFIEPTQGVREAKVAQKFTFSESEIAGKRIVVLDDSIVRGTTLQEVAAKLHWLGAKEIHVRIGSPPIKHPCDYGINIKASQELVAAEKTVDEIRAWLGVDSLNFLPLSKLEKLVKTPEHHCFACMTGKYW